MDDEDYTYEAHDFSLRTGGKRSGKMCCSKCGLVPTNNRFTEWAIKMGCNNRYHPSYANKRHETTKIF
jgi:hypothetical protein